MNANQVADIRGIADGIGHTLLLLIAELEENGLIDGDRFVRSLRGFADGRAACPSLHRSAATIADLSDRLDEARANRSLARGG